MKKHRVAVEGEVRVGVWVSLRGDGAGFLHGYGYG